MNSSPLTSSPHLSHHRPQARSPLLIFTESNERIYSLTLAISLLLDPVD